MRWGEGDGEGRERERKTEEKEKRKPIPLFPSKGVFSDWLFLRLLRLLRLPRQLPNRMSARCLLPTQFLH